MVQWARALRALLDEPLTAVKLPARYADQADSLVGRHVAAVDTHGKHLLIRLSDGRTLHCHGMIDGHWQVGRATASRQPKKRDGAALRTAEHSAVFVNGRIAELLTPAELAQHPRLTALGPDVMAADFDRREAQQRVQAFDGEIAEAIVDQKVVAGIGNIYKNEALFAAGIDPRRPVTFVAPEELDALWNIVIPMMWNEADCTGKWTTLPPEMARRGEQHWVYGRSRRRCLKCSNRIQFIRQGRYKRATYICATCQS